MQIQLQNIAHFICHLRELHILRRIVLWAWADADNPHINAQCFRADHEPGMRMHACTDIDRIGADTQRLHLLPQFQKPIHIRDAAVVITVRTRVIDLVPIGLQGRDDGLFFCLAFDQMHARAEQMREQ